MKKLPSERELGILVKKKPDDIEFGKRPEERTVEEDLDFGIINLNKPQGPTSHQVSDYVKKILKIKIGKNNPKRRNTKVLINATI